MSGKNVLLVVAYEMFRDEEYDEPRRALERAGNQVTVASSALGEATGRFGLTASVDVLVKDTNMADYDAVVYIGGPGAREYFDDPAAHKLAVEAAAAGKVIGAICIGPHTPAAAGVLKGKTATCFPSEADTLKRHGATYTGAEVEVDGNIVTASGPEAAKEFGEKLVEALSK